MKIGAAGEGSGQIENKIKRCDLGSDIIDGKYLYKNFDGLVPRRRSLVG